MRKWIAIAAANATSLSAGQATGRSARPRSKGKRYEDTMLTAHDNETLARVGPGSLASTLVCCHWVPTKPD